MYISKYLYQDTYICISKIPYIIKTLFHKYLLSRYPYQDIHIKIPYIKCSSINYIPQLHTSSFLPYKKCTASAYRPSNDCQAECLKVHAHRRSNTRLFSFWEWAGAAAAVRAPRKRTSREQHGEWEWQLCCRCRTMGLDYEIGYAVAIVEVFLIRLFLPPHQNLHCWRRNLLHRPRSRSIR